MTVQVIEIDQWSSTAENLSELSFAQCTADPSLIGRMLRGNDRESAVALGLTYTRVRVVSEQSTPPLATAWFRESRSGGLELWKANYDSGD